MKARFSDFFAAPLHSGCQHSTQYTPMQKSQSGWKVTNVSSATVQKVWMLWKSWIWGEKVLIFVNVSQFEWSFYLEVWMTRWALNVLEKVWKLRIFEDSVICLNGKKLMKNVKYSWKYEWYQLEKKKWSQIIHLNSQLRWIICVWME